MEERERELILVKLAEIDAENLYGTLDVSVERWARLYDDVVKMHGADDIQRLRNVLGEILDHDEMAAFRREHGLEPVEASLQCDDVDLAIPMNDACAEDSDDYDARERRRFIRLVKDDEVSLV